MFSPTGYFAITSDDEGWAATDMAAPPTGDYEIKPIVGWDSEGEALIADSYMGRRIRLIDYVCDLYKTADIVIDAPWAEA